MSTEFALSFRETETVRATHGTKLAILTNVRSAPVSGSDPARIARGLRAIIKTARRFNLTEAICQLERARSRLLPLISTNPFWFWAFCFQRKRGTGLAINAAPVESLYVAGSFKVL
jgi:hypothetical protein